MSKADEIQEKIRDAYNKYWEDSQDLVKLAVENGGITEEEAADIVIF